MNITKDLIMGLAAKKAIGCEAMDAIHQLAAEIEAIQKVVAEKAQVDAEIRAENARHEQVLDVLGKRRANLARTCPHPLTEHYTGTAEADGYTVCKVCGAEV